MVKINFEYNLKADAWSWVVLSNMKNIWGINKERFFKYIPKDVVLKLRGIDFQEAMKIAQEEVSNKYTLRRKKELEEKIKHIGELWSEINDSYFLNLEKLIDKPSIKNNWQVYITTSNMCPYNEQEGWFMVSSHYEADKSMLTIAHELFHFYFNHYFREKLLKQGVTKERIEDIKEAVTVLLNTSDMNRLIKYNDYGYPNHQKLREKIHQLFKDGLSFEKILDNVCLYDSKNKL